MLQKWSGKLKDILNKDALVCLDARLKNALGISEERCYSWPHFSRKCFANLTSDDTGLVKSQALCCLAILVAIANLIVCPIRRDDHRSKPSLSRRTSQTENPVTVIIILGHNMSWTNPIFHWYYPVNLYYPFHIFRAIIKVLNIALCLFKQILMA